MMADGRGGDRRQRVCFSGLRDFERLRPLRNVHTRFSPLIEENKREGYGGANYLDLRIKCLKIELVENKLV